MTFIQRRLTAIAGARHDVLAKTPVDRFRYITMGGVLLTTAAIAGVSATFALIMAVRLPLALAIVAGIGWGVVILNLDRLLTIGMTRRGGWGRNLLATVPRLALAVLLGTVISTPLVLRIFQPEIDSEMQIIDNQRSAAYQQQLATDPEFAAIPGLEKQLAAEQAIVNQDPNAVAANDKAVLAAQQKETAAFNDWNTKQQKAVCEADGTCGSRVPGFAQLQKLDQQIADTAFGIYQDSVTALNAAKQQARQAATAASQAAGGEVTRIQQDLQRRRQAKVSEQNSFDALSQKDNGLLARLEALSALGDQRGDLAAAQVVLFLLFLSIEILPVIVKLLQLSGPPTVYDQLVDQMEESAKRGHAQELSREAYINTEYAEAQAALEHDQARRQYEAGLRANELLVAEQAAIAQQAIHDWAAEARRRTQREMQVWFHHNGYPAIQSNHTQPNSAGPPVGPPGPPVSWADDPTSRTVPHPPPSSSHNGANHHLGEDRTVEMPRIKPLPPPAPGFD